MAKASLPRPLGSAHHGVGHWIVQRATAVALVPLGLWFVVSMVGLSGASYEEVRAWLSGQFNATLMILLVVAAFWHAKLGLEVVIQDYVHGRLAKPASLFAVNALVWVFAVSSILAILQVATGS
jgi:succinate dehydrogenase / fumarate reductase membrane anchor subunit